MPVLFEGLDTALHSEIGYMGGEADMTAVVHYLFPLNQQYDAALLEIQESWFEFKYLLLFSKGKKRFTSVVPVNEFYGGDGGQIRSESWLFFEAAPKLLTRFSEHYLDMSEVGAGGDPKDVYYESMRLQEWRGGEFKEIAVQDSSRWLKGFSVGWE